MRTENVLVPADLSARVMQAVRAERPAAGHIGQFALQEFHLFCGGIEAKNAV